MYGAAWREHTEPTKKLRGVNELTALRIAFASTVGPRGRCCVRVDRGGHGRPGRGRPARGSGAAGDRRDRPEAEREPAKRACVGDGADVHPAELTEARQRLDADHPNPESAG